MTAPMPVIVQGDARALQIPNESVDLIVTSPPYFGLRSYQDGGVAYDGQIGAEATPAEFIDALIDCTREWMRVLKPSGSIFVNLGDKYAGSPSGPRGARDAATAQRLGRRMHRTFQERHRVTYDVPNKSLTMLPERYRLTAVDDLGLTARAVIVWSKSHGNESVRDRVRRSHEDVVHLTKRPSYYSEWQLEGQRSVWEINTERFVPPPGIGVDHFATMPLELARRLVLGWSPTDGVVLDPFGGTGTTALVAAMHGRRGISVDLSADYVRLAQWRANDPKQRERASRPAGGRPKKIDDQPPDQQELLLSTA